MTTAFRSTHLLLKGSLVLGAEELLDFWSLVFIFDVIRSLFVLLLNFDYTTSSSFEVFSLFSWEQTLRWGRFGG
jgi:hypothetical protein